MKWLTLCIALLGLQPLPGLSAPLSGSKYDEQIQAAANRWLPSVDWRLYKAQLYQESKLEPDARSAAGAAGIAQFMPATWDEVSRLMGLGVASPLVAGAAIKAGAYYMHRLRAVWSWERPERDRHQLALASYNAGVGNVLDAQQLCDRAVLYVCVIACLPQVTGEHAQETFVYVQRVYRWYFWLVHFS